jgi:hypothetical protein
VKAILARLGNCVRALCGTADHHQVTLFALIALLPAARMLQAGCTERIFGSLTCYECEGPQSHRSTRDIRATAPSIG